MIFKDERVRCGSRGISKVRTRHPLSSAGRRSGRLAAGGDARCGDQPIQLASRYMRDTLAALKTGGCVYE